jgi:cell division GTPase FtsZ
MKKVGVLGLGNAGNQVADLSAAIADFDGIAINSSKEDLSNVKYIAKLEIGDNKGAGKNRKEACAFIKEKIEEILSTEEISGWITDKDIVFVISSIDGGTGSGSTPLTLAVLTTKFPKTKFILVPIYPDMHQSLVAMENSIAFLKEVNMHVPNAVIMSFDNNKFSDKSSDVMITTVNNAIVEAMKVLRMDYNSSTPFSSIDEKDLDRIVSMPGELFIAQFNNFTDADLDNETIEDHLIKIIKGDSAQVNIERDKIVRTFAVISNLNEDMRSKFNDRLEKVKDIVGSDALGFSHYYVNPEDGVNRVIVIMSGLSTPDTRIKEILSRKEELEKATKVRKTSILDTVEVTSSLDTPKAANETSINDILSKF